MSDINTCFYTKFLKCCDKLLYKGFSNSLGLGSVGSKIWGGFLSQAVLLSRVGAVWAYAFHGILAE